MLKSADCKSALAVASFYTYPKEQGSVAKNEQREYSDIDITLISNQFTNNFILNNKLTSKINIRFPLIEVHHFNSDYYKKGDPFINEINATGFEVKWQINENQII